MSISLNAAHSLYLAIVASTPFSINSASEREGPSVYSFSSKVFTYSSIAFFVSSRFFIEDSSSRCICQNLIRLL